MRTNQYYGSGKARFLFRNVAAATQHKSRIEAIDNDPAALRAYSKAYTNTYYRTMLKLLGVDTV